MMTRMNVLTKIVVQECVCMLVCGDGVQPLFKLYKNSTAVVVIGLSSCIFFPSR